MSSLGFISVPFKIEGAHGGFSIVNGIAKISRAGIILEFEAKIFGMMKTGVKEVRVPIGEIEDLKIKKRFFKFTLEIWLNNFKTINEVPNKDGRIILQIAKDDHSRAERAVKVLSNARIEKEALEILQTPVGRLFGDDSDAEDSG